MQQPHCGYPYPRQEPSAGSGKRKKRERKERGDPPLPPNLAQCAEPYRDELGSAFALGPVYKPRCRRCSRVSLLSASYAPFYVTASLWENGVRSPLPPTARGLPAPPGRGRVTKAKPNSRHFAYGLRAQSAPAEPSVSILQQRFARYAERLGSGRGRDTRLRQGLGRGGVEGSRAAEEGRRRQLGLVPGAIRSPGGADRGGGAGAPSQAVVGPNAGGRMSDSELHPLRQKRQNSLLSCSPPRLRLPPHERRYSQHTYSL